MASGGHIEGRMIRLCLAIIASFIAAAICCGSGGGGGNPCNVFEFHVEVDQWPAFAGESYVVHTLIWTIDGNTYDNCTVTFTKPDGEVQLHAWQTIGPKPVGYLYHESLPCELAQQGFAAALAMVRIEQDGSCPNHDQYWFFVRSADFDCDGQVNASDLIHLLGAWGSCGGAMCVEDMNIDDWVDVVDLLELIDRWGPTP